MNTSHHLCALCGQNPSLRHSHIIPAFVFRWTKSTSATGFLRFGENPNLRVQDGNKPKLLCGNCEGILNKLETQFANEIFYPYVNDELSREGVSTSTIKQFSYTDWLLRFAISVQWRVVMTSKPFIAKLPSKQLDLLNSFSSTWRDFLLGKRKDTGNCETHLIFLQNLASGEGSLPDSINDRINFYVMRCIDATITTGTRTLGVYVKFGPMCLYTSILPAKLKKLPHSKIHLKGLMLTAQTLANLGLTQFLFVDRPNEVLLRMKYSDKQKRVVHETYVNNPTRVEQSMTLRALEGDLILKQRKSST
ncbi:MAG TPA: hypothetical protein VNL36_08040 [Bacteroidota bacterium]|nr:hypothetical protein [Bacteroidota bacterium]